MTIQTPAPPGTDPGLYPSVAVSVRSVVGFLVFVELVSGFVQGYYSPLIARLGASLQVAPGDLNWFMSVQLLAAAVSVPVLSKLGDAYGHRRLLRIAAGSVALGTILVAVAPSFAWVLAGRVLMGPLAAFIALEVAIVRDRTTGATARGAIGLLISALTAGTLLGTLGSGFVDAHLGSLRGTLTVPAGIAVLGVLVTVFLIPETKTRAHGRIDWVGAATLAASLVLVLIGLSQVSHHGWTASGPIGLVAGGLVVLVGWVWWERRVTAPLVDMRFFVRRAMWPAMIGSMLFGVSAYGATVPLATFLAAHGDKVGYGFAMTSHTISAILAVYVVAAVIGSVGYAPAARWLGIRSVLPAGLVMIVAAFGWLIVMHSEIWMVLASILLSGLAFGILLAAFPAYVSEMAPATEVGIASGTYSTIKVLGGAVASAVFGTLLSTMVVPGTHLPTIGGYQAVWGACAATALLAMALLLAAWATRSGRSALAHS